MAERGAKKGGVETVEVGEGIVDAGCVLLVVGRVCSVDASATTLA